MPSTVRFCLAFASGASLKTITQRAGFMVLALTTLLGVAPFARADNPKLNAAILKKAKQATVLLHVKMPDGSEAEGSGFFAEEPGLVITNAHVLGMLDPDSRPPVQVTVVVNSGERVSQSLPGRVLGVDRGTDLGLLRVEGKNLPEILKVGSANTLVETQELYVFGFPFGKQLGKNITVSTTSVSSLRKSGAILDKIQVNGGIHPGNSGGPVIDGSGTVVGVSVSGLRGTQIQFLVPADKVPRFLNGRIVSAGYGALHREGDQIKIPVTIDMIDPLGRVRRVSVEHWFGAPGAPRRPSKTEPTPNPGDARKTAVALTYNRGTGQGELSFPATARPNQVLWVRPMYIDGTGAANWVSASTHALGVPLERRAVVLKYQLPANGRSQVELSSRGSFKVRDPDGEEHSLALHLQATLMEKPAAAARGEDQIRLRLEYVRLGLGVRLDDKPVKGDELLKKLAEDVKLLAANVVMDKQGNQILGKADFRRVPKKSRELLTDISDQVLESLELMSVPLPGNEVRPMQTWKAERHTIVGTMRKSIPTTVDMNYTYLGIRPRDGKNEAVINLIGTVRGREGKGLNVGGRVKGLAHISMETGQVMSAGATVIVDLDIPEARESMKATGTLSVDLKRRPAPSGAKK